VGKYGATGTTVYLLYTTLNNFFGGAFLYRLREGIGAFVAYRID
jgi:hypothetical protein